MFQHPNRTAKWPGKTRLQNAERFDSHHRSFRYFCLVVWTCEIEKYPLWDCACKPFAWNSDPIPCAPIFLQPYVEINYLRLSSRVDNILKASRHIVPEVQMDDSISPPTFLSHHTYPIPLRVKSLQAMRAPAATHIPQVLITATCSIFSHHPCREADRLLRKIKRL